MSQVQINETAALLRAVMVPLMASAPGADVDLAADLRRAVGNVVDLVSVHMRAKTMGSALQAAFTSAAAAGATVDGMDAVRTTALGRTAISRPTKAARITCQRFALIGMASAVTSLTFRSREDVQGLIARLNAGFAPAIDDAADMGDHAVYRDLVSLHAAATRDLTQRGRPLPRMVSYSFARRLPTLMLSQRLYGAGDRADEISGENKVVHPLFAPAAGRALSA